MTGFTGRLSILGLLTLFAAAFGCGDDDGSTGGTDSGTGGVADSGATADSGTTGEDAGAGPATASLRVIHLSPDAPATNDDEGNVFLIAQLGDGSTVRIDPAE